MPQKVTRKLTIFVERAMIAHMNAKLMNEKLIYLYIFFFMHVIVIVAWQSYINKNVLFFKKNGIFLNSIQLDLHFTGSVLFILSSSASFDGIRTFSKIK